MKAGVAAPDTYCAAASFSGAVDILDIYNQIDETDKLSFNNIFGSREDFIGSENDLYAATEKLAKTPGRSPKLYMWCGTEDFLYKGNTRFRDHVKKLGLPLTYEEGPGDHQWKYWDDCIKRILDWLPLRKDLREGI